MSSLVPRSGQLLAPQVDYILVDGSQSMTDKWWESLAALRYVHGRPQDLEPQQPRHRHRL